MTLNLFFQRLMIVSLCLLIGSVYFFPKEKQNRIAAERVVLKLQGEVKKAKQNVVDFNRTLDSAGIPNANVGNLTDTHLVFAYRLRELADQYDVRLGEIDNKRMDVLAGGTPISTTGGAITKTDYRLTFIVRQYDLGKKFLDAVMAEFPFSIKKMEVNYPSFMIEGVLYGTK